MGTTSLRSSLSMRGPASAPSPLAAAEAFQTQEACHQQKQHDDDDGGGGDSGLLDLAGKTAAGGAAGRAATDPVECGADGSRNRTAAHAMGPP